MWTHVGLFTFNNILQKSRAGLPCLWASVLWFCLFTVILVQYYARGDICARAALNSYRRIVNMQYILTVFCTIYRTTCCPHVFIMSGRVDVCAHDETKDKKKTKVISVRKVKVLNKLQEGNKNCCHCTPLGHKQTNHVFHHKKRRQDQDKPWGQCSIKWKYFLCKASQAHLWKEEKVLVCMAGRWGTENAISQWVLWWWSRPCSYTAIVQSGGERNVSFDVTKKWFENLRSKWACTTWNGHENWHLLILRLEITTHSIWRRCLVTFQGKGLTVTWSWA